ncbi:sigma 54-interacting transcriptional regulator [Neobacillus sp. GCM10023253]|uniref:sigma 54-interacting transcriptional regulator n=1 Tax=Neobacillus sp. GCM10023253 TaxID=3252644 RepID=UPI0036131311
MARLIISGSAPLDDLIKRAIEKKNKSIKGLVIESMEGQCILDNKNIITNEDVVICGSAIYKVFKDQNDRGQFVPIRLQVNDFLDAIQKGCQYSNEVNLINFNDYIIDRKIDQFESLFQVKIHQYTYETWEEAEAIIAQLKENRQSVVIGAGLITGLAKENGMHGIVWFGEESINLAVDIALGILNARFEEKRNSQRENYIMENFNEGVIISSDTGHIVNVNRKATTLLGIEEKDLSGLHVKEILVDTKGIGNTEWKKGIKEQIVSYKDKNFLLSTFPIVVDQHYDGMVGIFSDINAVQESGNRIRRKMYSKPNMAEYQFEDIVGASQGIVTTIKKAIKFSRTDSNVLILGESGTGKELFAQSIHNKSYRKDQPFIAINCAAVPDNLLESEFFGYIEGAFTGAKKGGKPGLFEKAHNGTVFLDEIGEIPLSMQAKLLRVLQEKVVMRVGSTTPIPVNVRVISATNVNLIDKVKHNEFRTDLYYRIAVLNLYLPPLRNRLSDLEPLVKFFTTKHYPQFAQLINENSKEIAYILSQHKWQGNIRELENTLERMFAYLEHPFMVTRKELLRNLREAIEENSIVLQEEMGEQDTFQDVIKQVEKKQIYEALNAANGSKIEAAKLLGISRSTLWRKLNQPD